MGFPAQYNPVSTMLEQIDDAINTINELNVWAKWGIGAFLTLVALGIMRLILKKVVLDFVKKTKFDWDDKLIRTCFKAYILLRNCSRFSPLNELDCWR